MLAGLERALRPPQPRKTPPQVASCGEVLRRPGEARDSIEKLAGAADHRGIVSLVSHHPFDESVRRLTSALAEHGVKVFAAIDQQAEAQAVGLRMPPTTLILFGNPREGTPLMLADPLVGLDLPLKVLVSESEPGRVRVSFNAAGRILQRHSLPSAFEANLAPAERGIASALRA